MKTKYYQLTGEQALAELKSSANGLTEAEVKARQEKYGPNVLESKKHTTLLQKFIAQFKDLMIVILMVAALVAMLAGEVSDALIIFLVVILNAVFGVFQEAKAENAIDALQEMTTPYSRVKRNGVVMQVKSDEIVPGDIVLLEAGDIVPADMRILESSSLKIEEAALTGESVPVDKESSVLTEKEPPLGEQSNLCFMNTSVTYGTAEAVVFATGMQTQVGHIATMLDEVDNSVTPLQKNITHLSKVLTVLILIIAVVIFVFGVMTGRESVLDMLLTAISLAVAAIPEGLPAIVTITLALGTQTMAKRKALVRKLPAVETLGTTEIIASDKTGTLTQNKMTVEQLYTDHNLVAADSFKVSPEKRLAQIMILANDSQETPDGLVGDPTETALIQYYLDRQMDVKQVQNDFPRINSIPFDSERKMMSAIVSHAGQRYLMTKGAVDEILQRTTKIEDNGEVRPITQADKDKILNTNQELALEALRVLGFAYKPLTEAESNVEATSDNFENDLIFAGMIGMIDPQRPEVKDAVAEAKSAGIRPLMITGDHKDTARAIAIRLGIIQPDDESGVITGRDLDAMSDEELKQNVAKYSVYARVAPEHKVRIVKAWQAHGKIVAMTGDGVNDAPALKTADIGVGMGITGTEVSKNASDIVLADDNFATIILAVREGRKVFANIQKAIQYLLSANLGEVLTLFMMTMLNWSIFAPVQILWINLVTDTFPAIALGVEKGEKDIMKKKPRGSKSNFLSNGVGSSIIYQGILEGVLTLGVYWIAINYPFHETSAQIHADALTMSYATLGVIQLFHAFNSKSIHGTIFSKETFNNKYFNIAVLASAVLLAMTIFVPAFNSTFHVTTLALEQWGIVLGAGALMIIIVEVVKFFQRKFIYKD
ncbi:cation-translocating P-type ATPase [Ligilactobacillus animalis]|uniref:cation-translocating P-type ATPase n=1 Tax=Ligilactobacillus animalis TaxID=1605 RepID=UPI0008251D42|nr:cation-translocating P-type ATPase [Ligilactobacillus animalis]MDO5883562.1 cation-translocating P-type ATPase [Ligilactobacillus animalis]MDQ2234699.1 cation-translocating P-type ATPase [Ligilactobacillus animalis]MDU1487814.1 cation-translocating P-type ATPase [Ligilactobacillus animalis]MDU8987078.1 cation-translocating P-type ATPase [Ligilactobacillus animalis]OCX49881.1 ATPase [Ligilactobacillus animalis]